MAGRRRDAEFGTRQAVDPRWALGGLCPAARKTTRDKQSPESKQRAAVSDSHWPAYPAARRKSSKARAKGVFRGPGGTTEIPVFSSHERSPRA